MLELGAGQAQDGCYFAEQGFSVVSTDPEYKQGKEVELDYFQIGKVAKRYFSEATVRKYTRWFDVRLLDELGETYKDTAKGVHNLVRFIGTKSSEQTPISKRYE